MYVHFKAPSWFQSDSYRTKYDLGASNPPSSRAHPSCSSPQIADMHRPVRPVTTDISFFIFHWRVYAIRSLLKSFLNSQVVSLRAKLQKLEKTCWKLTCGMWTKLADAGKDGPLSNSTTDPSKVRFDQKMYGEVEILNNIISTLCMSIEIISTRQPKGSPPHRWIHFSSSHGIPFFAVPPSLRRTAPFYSLSPYSS